MGQGRLGIFVFPAGRNFIQLFRFEIPIVPEGHGNRGHVEGIPPCLLPQLRYAFKSSRTKGKVKFLVTVIMTARQVESEGILYSGTI